VTSLKKKLKQTVDMFPVEVYIAAALKRDMAAGQQPVALVGVFAAPRHRDVRDKCSIVAARCRPFLILQVSVSY
jgi:hypothetical protein